jgi:hypothetical protein
VESIPKPQRRVFRASPRRRSHGRMPAVAAEPSFRFAIIADNHITDPLYQAPEGTESIIRTSEGLFKRLVTSSMPPPAIELVFLSATGSQLPSARRPVLLPKPRPPRFNQGTIDGYRIPAYVPSPIATAWDFSVR